MNYTRPQLKQYFCFISMLIFFNILFSQGYKDKKLIKLSASKTDTLKIQLLIDKGDTYFPTHPDTAYFYYKQALILSKKTNYKKSEANSLLRIGTYLNYKQSFKESLEYFLKAISIYESIKDEQGVANGYYYIGDSFAYINSYGKSFEYYFKAFEIYEKINDKSGMADVNTRFGTINYDQNNYTKAHSYYRKALENYEELNDKKGLIVTYINIGNVIADQGRLDDGVMYYHKSIKLAEELNDVEGIAINYTNIGDCYLVKGDYEMALEYFNKSLKLTEQFEYKTLDPINYVNIAETYLELKDYKKTILYANKSLESSKLVSWKYKEYHNYDFLSKAYAKLGDYKKAYENQKIFRKYSDSISNIKIVEQLTKLEVLYELENQVKEISLLEKKEELNNLKIKSQKSLNNILVVATVILLLLFILLNIQRKSKNKAYKLLAISKEKALESDRLKSAFLANMSHEIRTPMNAIMGFSEFLQDPDIGVEKRLKFVDIIRKSGTRLMNIINDIIDISKIESNQLKIDLKEIDITNTLKDIVEIQKKTNQLLLNKNVTLKFNNKDTISIKTDKDRFTQIVNNLLINAIKFTDKGSVEIGYESKNIDNLPFIEFYVKDTGCGIPKDKHHLIFERFSHAGENDYKQGNGIGLSICKGLVKLLHGEIWFTSSEGVGSTFYFTLPN
ncbi:tetratricopeptide repeat-containing sensor histidine kinase [Lutibacter sp.]|uniref:tetratricopeptide repeat-containing sensor histidine kinase n=1 Tax=Lutibacter sp. TaxID=1925666 RepID=UPI002734809B|nr:tetratricopeptide repeat-containing sensor histidine kinase [Lutibacter sp.]MDP3312399.1 tetratricopeptide repeat-containing sensor histidine kinase [Lutibacter sp.]